ncbi:regulatory protein, tetR family [Agrococcus jejuensis]|uniref:Regulatory protein, tetR family n=2 Tax=Agrococcus jejuensis TaxID=399736 RepID=A0A1G8ELT8_9MICO|nr:regulatory protein, tetR family [Agrococcus jejuensis]
MAPRSSSRVDALDAALALLRDGEAVSLESAARAAGITKPGLMYHFPTKQQLMLALVDHVVDRCEAQILLRVPDPASATPVELTIAYARWALEDEHDASDLVVFADPRIRDDLAARWTERFRVFAALDGVEPALRTRLLAVRMLADGVWFACAADVLPPSPADRAALADLVDELLAVTA